MPQYDNDKTDIETRVNVINGKANKNLHQSCDYVNITAKPIA